VVVNAEIDDLAERIGSDVPRALVCYERRGYRAGFRWGWLCGAVCGMCTTGLAVLLIRSALGAIG
jgi:hypothetical protein